VQKPALMIRFVRNDQYLIIAQ